MAKQFYRIGPKTRNRRTDFSLKDSSMMATLITHAIRNQQTRLRLMQPGINNIKLPSLPVGHFYITKCFCLDIFYKLDHFENIYIDLYQ